MSSSQCDILKSLPCQTSRKGIPFNVYCRGKDLSKIYQCQLCNKILKSNVGFNSHLCQQGQCYLSQLQEDRRRISIEYADDLIQHMANTNTPINVVQRRDFQMEVRSINPKIELFSCQVLRNMMLAKANDIYLSMLNELRGESVSLLIDGARRWMANYECVVIYSFRRLYLFDIFPVLSQDASSISNVIVKVVNILKRADVSVVSVCSDNQLGNVKALKDLSAQSRSGFHFLKISCSSHTGNLAIKDMFGTDPEFGCVSTYIRILLLNPPPGIKRADPSKIFTIRWRTLYDAVKFIIRNFHIYEASSNPLIEKALEGVSRIIDWIHLKDILKIVGDFISDVETDHSSIADVVVALMKATGRLAEIDSHPASVLSGYLVKRLYADSTYQLALFAFFVTNVGLDSVRCDHDRYSIFVDASKSGLRGYASEKNMACVSSILSVYDSYLTSFDSDMFNNYHSPFEMWRAISCNSSLPLEFREFARLASDVCVMPASEHAVERIFSALRVADNNDEIETDFFTIRARLFLKFDAVFKSTEN